MKNPIILGIFIFIVGHDLIACEHAHWRGVKMPNAFKGSHYYGNNPPFKDLDDNAYWEKIAEIMLKRYSSTTASLSSFSDDSSIVGLYCKIYVNGGKIPDSGTFDEDADFVLKFIKKLRSSNFSPVIISDVDDPIKLVEYNVLGNIPYDWVIERYPNFVFDTLSVILKGLVSGGWEVNKASIRYVLHIFFHIEQYYKLPSSLKETGLCYLVKFSDTIELNENETFIFEAMLVDDKSILKKIAIQEIGKLRGKSAQKAAMALYGINDLSLCSGISSHDVLESNLPVIYEKVRNEVFAKLESYFED
ncbi:MAG: hypothetical protein ACFE0O_14490 [Opitutales bacterium]